MTRELSLVSPKSVNTTQSSSLVSAPCGLAGMPARPARLPHVPVGRRHPLYRKAAPAMPTDSMRLASSSLLHITVGRKPARRMERRTGAVVAGSRYSRGQYSVQHFVLHSLPRPPLSASPPQGIGISCKRGWWPLPSTDGPAGSQGWVAREELVVTLRI